MTEKKVG